MQLPVILDRGDTFTFAGASKLLLLTEANLLKLLAAKFASKLAHQHLAKQRLVANASNLGPKINESYLQYIVYLHHS